MAQQGEPKNSVTTNKEDASGKVENEDRKNAGTTRSEALATKNHADGNNEVTNSNQPTAGSEVLDTTKPEYPTYVEVQKEILQKQTETVNTFVEGMQLNKRAVAIKEDEMKLRDQAEVTANKKEKAKLIEKADSLAMEGDIVTNHSKEKLSAAQKNTGTVKELTTKSEKLKAMLVVKEAPKESIPIVAVTTDSGKINSENSTQETRNKRQVNEQEVDQQVTDTENSVAKSSKKIKSDQTSIPSSETKTSGANTDAETKSETGKTNSNTVDEKSSTGKTEITEQSDQHVKTQSTQTSVSKIGRASCRERV